MVELNGQKDLLAQLVLQSIGVIRHLLASEVLQYTQL